jgi:hypothetical protein
MMSHKFVLRLMGVVVLVVACLVPALAQAHETVDSGNYHFEIGWVDEPVIIGERNALDLFVATKDKPDQGLAGAEQGLKFTVEYGGASQTYDLVPVEGQDGHYTAVFVPTRLGQYTFHLTGQIGSDAVDVSVKPEEVVAAGKLNFPDPQTAAIDLQGQVVAAQGQASTALLMGGAGLAVGAIGLVVAVVALLKKK